MGRCWEIECFDCAGVAEGAPQQKFVVPAEKAYEYTENPFL
ncbi:MAG: hypothetical protein Ct9H90mP11_00240 [Acidimicrobiales bacterium]|nr:MAG: hypothetical protein Ct9H90mP11_00240 [Acidimicrobiales bacterium]